MAQVVAQHILALRRGNRNLKDALVVIIPEANMAFTSRDICDSLKNDIKLDNVVFLMQDSSGDGRLDMPGSILTHKKKLEMVSLLINSYLRTRRICFHTPFVVARDDLSELNPRKEIVDQMRGFCEKRKIKFDPDGGVITVISYTGKEPVGKNDDFVICVMMAVFQHKLFWADRRYQKYWDVAGLTARSRV